MILFLILSQTFPKPYGFVNDYAKILNSNQINDLENYLRNMEEKTSVEIAIAIFDSIGYPIEEYANLLFEKWGIGKKGKDNGILVLVSIKEKLIRIEVGYGLEEIITDGIAGEIIRNDIVPYFKEGNYYLGLKSAILEIERRISNENQSYSTDKNNKKETGIPFLIGLFAGIFLSYVGLILGIIILFLYFIFKASFLFLISIGFITGSLISLLKMGKGIYISNGSFGTFSSGGFGGGLSGGGGATGKW